MGHTKVDLLMKHRTSKSLKLKFSVIKKKSCEKYLENLIYDWLEEKAKKPLRTKHWAFKIA